MSGLTFRQLVSFDELIAPRIIPVFFWAAEAAGAFAWIDFIRAHGIVRSLGGVVPMDSGGVAGATHVSWWNLVLGVVGLACTAILIRVVVDLVVSLFRWQEATSGILRALAPGVDTAAPEGEAAAGPAASVRPTTVSSPPPWESVPMAGMAPPPPPIRQSPIGPGAPTAAENRPEPGAALRAPDDAPPTKRPTKRRPNSPGR
jgi:hypothetical protein